MKPSTRRLDPVRGALIAAVLVAMQPAAAQTRLTLPNKDGSFKFAVIGDFGDGSQRELDTAAQFAKAYASFRFEVVPMTGDNLYGDERPQDFAKKFEQPFKALIDAGVKFYGALGNHDSREQRFYNLFNMNGKLYYSYKAPKQSVRFFALESGYMDPAQIAWITNELKSSTEDWKIAYFHHPLYSSGKTHGSDLELRRVLEPLFIQYNVSAVFQGHDHIYERIKPQNGIAYFLIGSGGRFRSGDLDKSSALTAKGYDTDNAFFLGEVSGDALSFNVVSRTGQVVDSGTVERHKGR
jgi:3',5'-cyclic AMP phosphodiesterase CpdA